VDIVNAPYRVDDLLVPVSFSQIIDDTRRSMDGLSEQIDTKIYQGNSDDAYLKLHRYEHIYILLYEHVHHLCHQVSLLLVSMYHTIYSTDLTIFIDPIDGK